MTSAEERVDEFNDWCMRAGGVRLAGSVRVELVTQFRAAQAEAIHGAAQRAMEEFRPKSDDQADVGAEICDNLHKYAFEIKAPSK
jgi:hypothetical protein